MSVVFGFNVVPADWLVFGGAASVHARPLAGLWAVRAEARVIVQILGVVLVLAA